MKSIVLAALLAVAAALPRPDDPKDAIVLRDDRVHPSAEGFSTNFETDNGINVVESGSAGEKGQTNMQGVFTFPLPNGELAQVKWVSNEFGYQPESDLLPVAPVFPHPIPQFVLDQIYFAEQQQKEQN